MNFLRRHRFEEINELIEVRSNQCKSFIAIKEAEGCAILLLNVVGDIFDHMEQSAYFVVRTKITAGLVTKLPMIWDAIGK